MNVNQPKELVPPADQNRVLWAGAMANPDELKDDLKKCEHLQEFAERFFAAKRRHPEVPQLSLANERKSQPKIGRDSG